MHQNNHKIETTTSCFKYQHNSEMKEMTSQLMPEKLKKKTLSMLKQLYNKLNKVTEMSKFLGI